MPSGALTRFLKQGLARAMCPLCRVAHKVDTEYIWYFFDEYSGDKETLDALRRARGFCAEHADALRRLEVDGFKSTLGISTTYLDTIEGLVEEFASLRVGGSLPTAACPACAYRQEEVQRNAGYLLAEIGESEQSRQRFLDGPGLCMPHLALVWPLAGSDERLLLLEIERRNMEQLAADLREHIRKQGAEAKEEQPGAEADAWERALRITAGWPASVEEGARS